MSDRQKRLIESLSEAVSWSVVKNNLRSMTTFVAKLEQSVRSENPAAVANMCIGIVGVAARLAGVVTGDQSIHAAAKPLQEKIHAAAQKVSVNEIPPSF